MRIVPTLLPLALSLGLAACASTGGQPDPNDPTANLRNAEVIQRVQDNGDVIEEYRVAGQLRVVKVTPARGPVYYLIDNDGDGRPDDGAPVSPVYWKLFEWN
ncbi:hypothetical protein N792_11130 [Lysobacter concretionis Ko07 = DSM 16239]|uniref:DUF2782 domain-containing protein n=1 Tax=Lysobacter concretionis Ko07 = DSM 16239 TaxID=1122185 RepID=A0A0A0EQ59_9GAMM|nr:MULTISPECIES: DUF2782 domain-containing protein [Lysobacter]KGM51292.1 hypothetical protein N792_11130 [Lysobacter concretionis Ko07 = DSM 16239]QOD90996.1 DUF2782 domain-containing protein [Lysobacter sp. CW239]